MAFELRHLDNYGSGFGTLLIIVPFIMSVILTAVFIPTGDMASVGGLNLYLPETYSNMTEQERVDWLFTLHGGLNYKEFRWGFALSWPDFAGRWYYIFNDGTEMTQAEIDRFKGGDADKVDYLQVALAMLSINPPALEKIGIFGVLLRIILIASICIGLVEIVWIGG